MLWSASIAAARASNCALVPLAQTGATQDSQPALGDEATMMATMLTEPPTSARAKASSFVIISLVLEQSS
jgi:hypothetical protein